MTGYGKYLAASLLLGISALVVVAATRNVVPNADNEGDLGTAAKTWSDVRAQTGTFDTVVGHVIGTDVQAWDADLDTLALKDGSILTNIAYIRAYAITNNTAAPTDNYILKYDSALGYWNFEVDADSGGATAWDDIGNPDADDEIDFGSYTTELNVVTFRIGDGGANYVQFDGTPTVTFAGNADINLPDDSVDTADIGTDQVTLDALNVSDVSDDIAGDIAEGELADDVVLEADLKIANAPADEDILTYESTGGQFEWHTPTELGLLLLSGGIMTGYIDAGGFGVTNFGILRGDEIYVDTIAADNNADGRPDLDASLDGQSSYGISNGVYTGTSDFSGGSLEIPNAAANAALTAGGQIHMHTSQEMLEFHSAADGEISGEAALPLIVHKYWTFDPAAVCDGTVDRLLLFSLGDQAPDGITIDEWKVSFTQDPGTEADLDLKYANAFIGVAGATVIDVLDTTNGTSSEDTDANINGGAVIDEGKVIYLEFGTAYTATGEQMIFEIWYHLEAD